jgi:hypothetical protein
MSVEERPFRAALGHGIVGLQPAGRPSEAAGKKKPRHKAGATSNDNDGLVAGCPKLSSIVWCNQPSVRRSDQSLFDLPELHAFDIPRQA